MLKYCFYNDYSEGAHPRILELLQQTNNEQEIGYGADRLSERATQLIHQALGKPDADVHFVTGGTQANLIVLASMLRSHESVIAAQTGPIFVHEAGAIEATGHRISIASSVDGKLTPESIKEALDQHTDEHMVKPRAVFISNATELGTVYTRRDLENIHEFCRSRDLYLYMDGARLGAALCSTASDAQLPDLCDLVDVFYIGGTKNGALIGEAIVINHPDLRRDFRYHIKQRGALLAKGRLIATQFVGLFTDGLFFDLARHADAMAVKLQNGISTRGFGFYSNSTTNLIFPILPDRLIQQLRTVYGFHDYVRVDATHSAVRIVTSWATPEARVDEFLQDFTGFPCYS